MNIKLLDAKKLLKKLSKVVPSETDFNHFKSEFIKYSKAINNQNYTEEAKKGKLIDFFKSTYYKDNLYKIDIDVNDIDLVIRIGKNEDDPIGIIFETKREKNKNEMLTTKDLNRKALHQLILHFLNEVDKKRNIEVKHIIATNFREWFIFDAISFNKLFGKNTECFKLYKKLFDKQLILEDNKKSCYEVFSDIINNINEEIEFIHFDINDFDIEKNEDLIKLYKLFSPEHLLKKFLTYDNNTLDKYFYLELLHILGLEEKNKKSKKIIERKSKHKRNFGSLIEETIRQLESLDLINDDKGFKQYGIEEEKLFNIAIELNITWINRILFLKLLESQLLSFHKNEKDKDKYRFINAENIKSFGHLNNLFFQILAMKQNDRYSDNKFPNIPYLNSSLFEPTELEKSTIFINSLTYDKKIPLAKNSVLKSSENVDNNREITILNYLLDFLNSYDFGSETVEGIIEKKGLINATVLGLIFERINGYKDGAYFTPSYVTMYMSREVISKAIIQKFNDIKGWKINNLTELHNNIKDFKEANEIINSLTICDPAVGSGHFLVSALNEIISIKSELDIILHKDGKTLRDCNIRVENDELVIEIKNDGTLFEYDKTSRESQRIQETLFNEKKTIIENCLFGVDINPNSVLICRLRLWIELLKNSYYKTNNGKEELETLPNIDINIKHGNSLISRFSIESDLSKILAKSDYSIKEYLEAIRNYQNTNDKKFKNINQKKINKIKNDFKIEMYSQYPKKKKLNELETMLKVQTLPGFEKSDDDIAKIKNQIDILKSEIKEYESGKIYENAFEWRFEFPEVLNEKGEYKGFDIIIGNPPYMKERGNLNIFKPVNESELGKKWHNGKMDYLFYFIHKAINIIKRNGLISYITPSYWIKSSGAKKVIEHISKELSFILVVDIEKLKVFENVAGNHMITVFQKNKDIKGFMYKKIEKSIEYIAESDSECDYVKSKQIDNSKVISDEYEIAFNDIFIHNDNFKNLYDNVEQLGNLYDVSQGLVQNPDKVSKENVKKLNNIKENTGVFVINKKEELPALNLCKNEMKFIKKFYEEKDYNRYKIYDTNKCLIYLTKNNCEDISDYPNLKKHLEKFKPIMEVRRETKNGSIKWFHLNWPRKEINFNSPKIIMPSLLIKPSATYSHFENYFGMSTNIIISQNENYCLKYLLGLLNSKFAYCWYYNKCKYRGAGVDVGVEKLRTFPVPTTTPQNRKLVKILVDYILFLNNFYKEEKEKSINVMRNLFNNILNYFVYELYFKKEILAKNIEISCFLEESLNDIDYNQYLQNKNEQGEHNFNTLKEIYNNLKNKNEIWQNIDKLNTLVQIKIIENYLETLEHK